jgi:Na+-driven multidrug efflux pump
MGINGVWAAIVLSQIAKALLKSWWFRTRILRRLEVRAPSTCMT